MIDSTKCSAFVNLQPQISIFNWFFFRMRYVAAYLLAVLGGKVSPAAADVEKILSSVGIEADGEKLKKVISELSGKNVEELIEQGECCT